jgi:hypothetical protein
VGFRPKYPCLGLHAPNIAYRHHNHASLTKALPPHFLCHAAEASPPLSLVTRDHRRTSPPPRARRSQSAWATAADNHIAACTRAQLPRTDVAPPLSPSQPPTDTVAAASTRPASATTNSLC